MKERTARGPAPRWSGALRRGRLADRVGQRSTETKKWRRHFSGFYEAVRSGDSWAIIRRIPFDSTNFIRTQNLSVDVFPADGIEVVDTVGIVVGAPWGFGVRLNNALRLRAVSVDGKPADHAFGGGVLWIKTQQARWTSSFAVLVGLAGSKSRQRRPRVRHGCRRITGVRRIQQHRRVASVLRLSESDNREAADRRGDAGTIPAEYYLTTTTLGPTRWGGTADGVRPEPAQRVRARPDLRPQLAASGLRISEDFGFKSLASPTFAVFWRLAGSGHEARLRLAATEVGEPQRPSRYLAAVQDRRTRRRRIQRPDEQRGGVWSRRRLAGICVVANVRA